MKTTQVKACACIAFFIAFVGLSSSRVYAQLSDQEVSSGLESCFLYYNYGKVSVNLATQESSYLPGSTAEITGTLVNQNSFPLTDIVLYAQLYRINDTGSFSTDGHFLVDRIPLVQGLTFLPGETKPVSASLPILATYPNGSYRITYYVASSQGFHYAGRPFLEEDYAGTSLMDITGGMAPEVVFNASSLSVNNQPHHVRDPIVSYPKQPLTFRVSVSDNRSQKGDIPVTVRLYSFEDTYEQNLIETRSEVIPAATGVLTTTIVPPRAGAYVLVAQIDSPVRTLFKYRFAQQGTVAEKVRINDLGVTNYPATDQDKAYVCFHSPAPEKTVPTTISLKVLDDSGAVVAEKSISQSLDGNIRAMSIPLANLKTKQHFSLVTHWGWKDATGKDQQDEIKKEYDCDTFSNSQHLTSVTYQEEQKNLQLHASTSCGENARTGGFVESVQIKNDQGIVQKELYNQSPEGGAISLEGLPPGNYTADIVSPEKKEQVHFAVAGTSTASGWSKWWKLLIPLFIAVIGYSIYRIKTKKKHSS